MLFEYFVLNLYLTFSSEQISEQIT